MHFRFTLTFGLHISIMAAAMKIKLTKLPTLAIFYTGSNFDGANYTLQAIPNNCFNYEGSAEVRSMKLGKDTNLCDLYDLAECEEDEDYGPIQVTGPLKVAHKEGIGPVKSFRCYCK